MMVTKCAVLMMSLFVFFTTTMSVSFTLRETQTRMLKFTVQLQHHARHQLPTFQLIFVHVIESLVFVPIMIGILFFLFEFYDDQLLAFMVLILVWLSELFTLVGILKRVLEEVEKVMHEFKGTLYKSMEDPQIDLTNVSLGCKLLARIYS
ncbi:hypothetical protein RchiOBHm_Chr7g0230911 [Rosa chinensis]|uniref:Uncharacterized protein n=1 Tax=Rosa chinensis TaxID=74649 RepID=A0A2P6PFI3_ROSCH|nr:hypothetical protein RchiOBHm_Chr7g0230911 [Rosa chinensis]